METPMTQTGTKLDVEVVFHGSVVAFHLLSQDAKNFVEEFTDADGWQFMGNALCVDHRMAEGLVDGMLEHGLEVR
jgi:hypothetical protein